MTQLSQMLWWYGLIFGAIIAYSMAQDVWYATRGFFQDGRFRRLLERLRSGDVFLDLLRDLSDFAFTLLFSLPYIGFFVAGAFVLEEFLKTRIALWGVMTALAVWTALWAYMVQTHLSAKSAEQVCELIIEPNFGNLIHHQGYKRYYDVSKEKIDRLRENGQPIAGPTDDPDKTSAYQEQQKRALGN